MIAKTQTYLDFRIDIGTNEDEATIENLEDALREFLLEFELKHNSKNLYRIHVSEDK